MTLVETAAKKLAILVVDDELIVRESLGAWFKEDGYKVDTAENARDALRLAAEGRYDVAFLDIKMSRSSTSRCRGWTASSSRRSSGSRCRTSRSS